MDNESIIEGVRTRLAEQLEARNLTMRAASLKANLGASYLQSVLKNGTEPNLGKLAQVCQANNLSLSYIMTGVDITPQARRILDLVQENPDRSEHLVRLLSDN